MKPGGRAIVAATGLALLIRGANLSAADHSPEGLLIGALDGSDVRGEGAGDAESVTG